MRRLVTAVVLAVAVGGGASALAAVRVVVPFEPAERADEGAIGLAVPGAGPTVTRASALNTLLTGEVESSHLGGTPPGEPRIRLGEGAPPDVLVVLPPPGRSANDRYPIALVGEDVPRGVLTSDSTRIAGLVSLADVANGDLRVEEVDDPVATLERLERRIDRNDRIRLPLVLLCGAVALLVATFAPRFGPRVFLVALALNLWLAGWWLVAPLAIAVAVLPLGPACAVLIGAYLMALGLDPESVALSPFGPSQAGRFYGLSNLLATMLLLPALLGTALLGAVGVLVAVAAAVMVGGSRFGADGGGLLVLLAGFATIWLARGAAASTRGEPPCWRSRRHLGRRRRRTGRGTRRVEPRHERDRRRPRGGTRGSR